jgi:hypothetical protein
MGPTTSSQSRSFWLDTQSKSPTIYRLEVSLTDQRLPQAHSEWSHELVSPRPRQLQPWSRILWRTVCVAIQHKVAGTGHSLAQTVMSVPHSFSTPMPSLGGTSISTIYHCCRHLALQLYNNNTKHYTYITPVSNTHGGQKPTTLGNDPSAGSPTEALLRLLLPLND